MKERVEREASKDAEIEKMRAALNLIKEGVVGDKNPRWSDDYKVTIMRGKIADICDTALLARPRDLER